MNTAAFQLVRICVVIALVCIAAALATPKGRLPLALRGLAKLLNTVPDAPRVAGASRLAAPSGGFDECGQPAPSHATRRGRRGYGVSAVKRSFAFILVLLAILLALI